MSKFQGVMATVTGLAVALLACAASAQDAPREKAAVALRSDRRARLRCKPGWPSPAADLDVPAAPARDEDKAAAGPRDDIDARLRICRGC